MINNIKEFVCPFINLYKATKAIDEKIKCLNLSSPENPYRYEYASINEQLKIEILDKTLKETIENKKILEDKAKSSLIAISISSTLIFSILKFMQDTNNAIVVLLLLAIVSFISLIYMVSAGVMSLYSIGEINTVSMMFPDDYLLDDQEKRVQIADSIEYNYLNNMKRNNFMTASYKCMITSIAFLAIIFIVSTVIPFQGHVNNDATEALKKEIETLNCRISTMITDGNTDRADIISKQQILIKALNDNKVLENKLNEVRLSIDGINKRIANNPNQISNDLKKCLLELQENINK